MRGNKPGCMSHGRHGRDPLSVKRFRAKQNAKYRNDPEYRQKIRANQGARLYGITPEEYIERRSRPCEICGVYKVEEGKRGSGMHIDHDHKTDRLRGTLCDKCNRGLGLFDDDPTRLDAAAAYLRKYA